MSAAGGQVESDDVTSEHTCSGGCGGHDGGGPLPLLLSAERAAGLLGIGQRFFWTLHTTGQLGPEPIKLGRRLLWSRFDLERWVAARCPHRERWSDPGELAQKS